MTIAASHELGLGIDRNKGGDKDIDPDMSKIEPYSRNYLHVIDDLTRIHRLLRPMKAKVAAIQLAIKSSPPLCHLCKETPIGYDDDDSPTRPQARTWEKSISKMRGTQRRAPTNGSSSINAISVTCSTETLVKKYGPSLKSLFQEAVEKVWWRPFCEDYHLPPNTAPGTPLGQGVTPGRNTLGRACAFIVGRTVAHLQEDDLPTMEKYYNIMPSYMRRFAVLQHITELCVLYIPVALLIQPLVTVCVQYKADYQGLSLLQHMFECQDTDFQLNYVWAYSATQQLGCSDEWIRYLSQSLRTDHLYRKSFHDFLSEILPEHRARLVKAAFDTLMDQAEPLAAKRIWRPKVISWASQLIEDSLSVHQKALESEEKSCTSVCDEVMEYIAQRIYTCATAKCGATVAVWNSLRDLGVGLALHSLYIAVTGTAALDENEKVDRWISLLQVHNDRNTLRTDFDVVFKAYGLLTNLNALALMLDAVGLYDLSMRVLQEVIFDYEELSSNTKEQLGYLGDVTLSDFSRHLEEVRQRKRETFSREEWYYDDVLDEWVERGQSIDQIQKTSEQSSDEEDQQYISSAIAKPRRSVDSDDRDFAHDRDYLSDISFDSLAENARTPPRRKRRTTLRISPFVLRSPIHFSMTPMKRLNLPAHETAPSYMELDDLDRYQYEEHEEEEVAEEDQEDEQLNEVSLSHFLEVMGDSDTDPDAYVKSGSVSSNSVSSFDSARSGSSHTSASVRDESDTESQSDRSLAEESTQRVESQGSDSDMYVDPSERRKSSPVYRRRKYSPGLWYSSPHPANSESESPSPAPHVAQTNDRNHGVFLYSGSDTTPRPRRFRVNRFSHSPSPSPDKSPLRRHTKKNRHLQMLTDSDSESDALPSSDQRNPKHVTVKKRMVSVPRMEVPGRKYSRKLLSDSCPSPNLDVLSDHFTESKFEHEYEPSTESPPSLRNWHPRQPSVSSVVVILDTEESEQSGENSVDEYKPQSRQTKRTTRSSSPMHKTLRASSLARARTTSTAWSRWSVSSKTTSSVSNPPNVYSRTSLSTPSPSSVETPIPRAENKPIWNPRRKKRTISTILDSDFSDSGDSEYTESGSKPMRRSAESSSKPKAKAKPMSLVESRKRRSVSYGDEPTEEDQSDADDDDEEEFVHRRKHARSARLS
ncbi:hypothetical protein BGZ82_003583 [Podila clonocystis]|nr:hypothetical protein BGZ82_003583 [Podila clonocystis]